MAILTLQRFMLALQPEFGVNIMPEFHLLPVFRLVAFLTLKSKPAVVPIINLVTRITCGFYLYPVRVLLVAIMALQFAMPTF